MAQTKPRFSLSEDWLATLIGLAIVLVISSGLLGPGPQIVTLKAKPGEIASADALAVAGWKAAATLGSDKVSAEAAPSVLESARTYGFTCAQGQIKGDVEVANMVSGVPPAGKAALVLDNHCDQDAALTFTTDPAIRWPLFSLLAR